MRAIIAWRGQVVENFGAQKKRLMGNIGDRADLGKFVKTNDWNQYTVIARGPVCMHIVNGQLLAVDIDDDPNSSNNQPGYFGIEIEAITKVSVRNIWVKKFGLINCGGTNVLQDGTFLLHTRPIVDSRHAFIKQILDIPRPVVNVKHLNPV